MAIRKTVQKAAKTAADTAASALNTAAKTAADMGGKAAEIASARAATVAELAQKKHLKSQMARYNPVFPEEFNAPDYDLPDMIVVVDGDQRKGIEVCEGAIGWLSIENKMEILHLYEEFAPASGIDFYPYAKVDTAYHLDAFNRDRFIQLDSYYDVIQKEKLSELGSIAHALGAKECYLEVREEDRSSTKSKIGAAVEAKNIAAKGSGSFDQESKTDSYKSKSITIVQNSSGSDDPIRPELRWFAKDKEIKALIDKRLSGTNPIKDYSINIDTAASSTMSLTHAEKLDASLKAIKIKTSTSFEQEALHESKRKFVFRIKF